MWILVSQEWIDENVYRGSLGNPGPYRDTALLPLRPVQRQIGPDPSSRSGEYHNNTFLVDSHDGGVGSTSQTVPLCQLGFDTVLLREGLQLGAVEAREVNLINRIPSYGGHLSGQSNQINSPWNKRNVGITTNGEWHSLVESFGESGSERGVGSTGGLPAADGSRLLGSGLVGDYSRATRSQIQHQAWPTGSDIILLQDRDRGTVQRQHEYGPHSRDVQSKLHQENIAVPTSYSEQPIQLCPEFMGEVAEKRDAYVLYSEPNLSSGTFEFSPAYPVFYEEGNNSLAIPGDFFGSTLTQLVGDTVETANRNSEFVRQITYQGPRDNQPEAVLSEEVMRNHLVRSPGTETQGKEVGNDMFQPPEAPDLLLMSFAQNQATSLGPPVHRVRILILHDFVAKLPQHYTEYFITAEMTMQELFELHFFECHQDQPALEYSIGKATLNAKRNSYILGRGCSFRTASRDKRKVGDTDWGKKIRTSPLPIQKILLACNRLWRAGSVSGNTYTSPVSWGCPTSINMMCRLMWYRITINIASKVQGSPGDYL